MSEHEVKDDGTRRTYETGARRSSPDGKGRYDLIPPEALRRLALVYEKGARLHGQHNWRRAMPFSRLISSAMRHLQQFIEGADTTEDHLAQSAWNLFAIMAEEVMISRRQISPELDDRWRPSVTAGEERQSHAPGCHKPEPGFARCTCVAEPPITDEEARMAAANLAVARQYAPAQALQAMDDAKSLLERIIQVSSR